MRGYIREYRTGKWSFSVYVGKDERGKAKKIERGGFTSKKECELALNKKLVELAETGTVFTLSNITFDELYREFVDLKRFEWKESTLKSKEAIYNNHLKDLIGFRYIKSLKTSDINEIFKAKMDKGFKPETILGFRKIINAALKFAVEQKYIKVNPCFGSFKPRKERKKLEVFTPEELTTILKVTEHTNYHPVVYIGIYTGMRIGEILGLRWSDVDFENRTININKQLMMERGRKALDNPKAKSSRIIKIPQTLNQYLQDLKAQQDDNRRLLAEQYNRFNKVYSYFDKRDIHIEDFICVKADGVLLHRGSLLQLTRICKRAGVDFYLHKLRHTFATTLLEKGASLKMVQRTLGHRSVITTLTRYAHITEQHNDTMIDLLPTY